MELHQVSQLEDFQVGDDDFEEVQVAHILPLFWNFLVPVSPTEGLDVLEVVQGRAFFRQALDLVADDALEEFD